jgi:predicted small lipoprotein YifL
VPSRVLSAYTQCSSYLLPGLSPPGLLPKDSVSLTPRRRSDDALPLALPARLPAGAPFILLALLATAGCGGKGPTDLVLPSLTVRTSTTGVEIDPDGYRVSIDGQPPSPVGVQATLTINELTDGQHSVELSGLAPNCAVSGANPSSATVRAGETANVAFAVACGATTGTLEVVTSSSGQPGDADGFVIVLDGAASNPIGATATVTFPSIATGLHTVELSGVAPNCQVTGDHPLGVAVEPGETARVSFAINCSATAGELAVTVSGLPPGIAAAVTVTGPNSFSSAVTGTRSLTGLSPGTYTVAATNVVTGGATYAPSIGRPTVDVVAGGTAAVTVSYTAVVANLTLNLRVDGLYLTQSTQTYGSGVPLVVGRDGYLRVFVVANESNSAKPRVQVRLSTSTQTFTIEAPGASTPTTAQEGTWGSSWNLPVDAALIRPGLSIEATVDPGGLIAESNENDNRSTKAPTVGTVPTARVRFVSVQQGSSAAGNVSNPGRLMALARRMHPLSAVEVDVHPEVFTASQPLQANGAGWDQVLGDLDAKRLVDPDGANRIYFGIAKLDYLRSQGLVGNAFTGIPTATTALGWDDTGDASRVVAHELGHIWGRKHSPCNSPPDLDALYPSAGPYAGGKIGVYGLDMTPPVTAADLRARSNPDIMGYCFDSPWVSDYTYQGVMSYRQANPSAVLAALPQPSVLVWGRIVNGRPVLEPAFQIVSRPSLPRRPGPYSVTATAADGTQLFALSFEAALGADGPQGGGHFAFAVPLDPARTTRLANLRLAGPGGVVASSRPTASLQPGASGSPVTGRREGQSVMLQWNASAHPTIMVRDPDTGSVLSFVRGGNARVWTSKGELDLELSDGVKSQRLRVAINRS